MTKALSTGIKIIIAFLIIAIAHGISISIPRVLRGEMFFSLNFLSCAILVVAIYGLRRMKRWGLWLTIATSLLSVIAGFIQLVFLMNRFSYFISLPMSRALINFYTFTFSGPIQFIAAILIIIYLYKHQMLFR